MILAGLARLGNDAELRYTPEGTPVCNLSLAYNHGRKGSDQKKPTQWVEASLWGDRAVALHPYLKKGKEFDVVLEDPHIEPYPKRGGGEGAKLVARVLLIDFASGQRDGQEKPAGEKKATGKPAAASGGNFNDFDDDRPF
jgi:single-strand DNA-binding protein